jgi:hypothetical protein
MSNFRWFAVFSWLAAVFLLSLPRVVLATPDLGGNCKACHGRNDAAKATVQASKTFPIASRKDGGTNTNSLPVFEALPGATVSLAEMVNNTGGTKYSVALTGRITGTSAKGYVSLASGGILGAFNSGTNTLKFTTDSAWTSATSSPVTWNYVGPNSATTGHLVLYNMTVNASTIPDFYALTFQTAGGIEDWNATQEFYLRVLFPGWKALASGSYNQAANWTAGAVPTGVGATAIFPANITAPSTLTLDSPVTAGTINFNSALPYTVAGPSNLSLQVGSGNASINLQAGSHQISAPVVLLSDAVINGPGALDLSGGVSGTHVLSVASGTLSASRIATTTLAVGAAPAATVPEPGTLIVLGTGIMGLFLCLRRRKL